MSVSSYSDCMEHDVHLCALYFMELPFMLIDFQMMLGGGSMGHSQYEERGSIGGKLQLDSIGK